MKGISPLIASVLLIAFTLAIATLIFGFLTTTVNQAVDTTTNRSNAAIDCASASIRVEDVYITGNSSASTVTVVVKNTGYADGLVIQDAQVFNKTGSNFTTRNLPIANFNKGNIMTLVFGNVSFSSAACPQGFSKAVVTTTCGAVAYTFSGTPKCS